MKKLHENLYVGPQLGESDLRTLADQGFSMLINNRPDGEEPGQPSSAALRTGAEALGLSYHHNPVSGRPGPEQAAEQHRILSASEGKAFMFCRSGMRSTAAWAMGSVSAGTLDADTARQRAADAGYDLSGLPLE